MKICSTLLMMIIIIEVLFTPTFTIRSTRITATAAAAATITTTTPTTLTKNTTTIHHVEGNTEIIGHRIQTPAIVIQTQQRNYEEPTLKEYEECHVKLQKCQQLCNTHLNRTACELDECPICPILIDNNILIQGVNDTNKHDMMIGDTMYHNRNQNTTNIIRLTNDIHNIIDNRLGNVTHNNINNVHIQHNISRVMTAGKYGLGYNNDGQSCCLLLHDRQCNDGKNDHDHEHHYNRDQHHHHRNHHHNYHRHNNQRHSNGCHYKHQRVCGKKCTARIIQVKRVKICEQYIDDVNEIDYIENNNCHIDVRYIPYHPAHQKRSMQRYARHITTKCHFQPYWPYVHCSKRYYGRNSWHNMCGYCYRYPYGHLLNYGLPQHCYRCFNHMPYVTYYNNLDMPPFIWPWNNFNRLPVNDYNYYDVNTVYNYEAEANADMITDTDTFAYTDMDKIMENWQINKTTCKLEDGTLSDECIELIWNNNENHLTTESPVMAERRNKNYNNDDDTDNDDYIEDDYNNNNHNNNNMDDYIVTNNAKADDIRTDKREHHYLFKRSKYSHRHRNA